MKKRWLCVVCAPIILFLLLNALLAIMPLVVEPEVFATSCQLAEMYNFDCTEHSVTTKDGYILTVHRVNKQSSKLKKPPETSANMSEKSNGRLAENKIALLMHCLECDSSVFLTNTAKKSLGFMLASSDIDVWLGNVRGTYYSKKHRKLSIEDEKYWDFTWQEMAWYDLPAIVDYIKSATNQQKIYYIGQSQGTLIGLTQFAQDPDLEASIKRSYMLSPFVTLQNIRSPVKYFLGLLYTYGKFIGDRHFFPFSHTTASKLAALFCPKNVQGFCLMVYRHFSGFSSPDNLNPSRISVYFAHAVSGTSLKNVRHYAQLHVQKTAAYFDHLDSDVNLRAYGVEKPPIVDVSNVDIPVALFAGDTDWLVSEVDVQYLKDRLPNVFYFKNCTDFAHLDFIWGTHADDCAYRTIVSDILNS
ncbi:lysosomal acid lipase/cholesteryl ester hydrolase-like [Symsagittifera roscoffensis]|uniref:lysosomal acid lipase/cholesteryl ester hydrolase-like n=1 Tax=Symsagittifera roscoffensis TaxID=84072 RepID=UPI00307C486A